MKINDFSLRLWDFEERGLVKKVFTLVYSINCGEFFIFLTTVIKNLSYLS